MFHPNFDTLKGLGGLGALIVAQLTAFQSDIIWGLQALSLLAGLIVAVLTIRSMILKQPRRRKKGED